MIRPLRGRHTGAAQGRSSCHSAASCVRRAPRYSGDGLQEAWALVSTPRSSGTGHIQRGTPRRRACAPLRVAFSLTRAAFLTATFGNPPMGPLLLPRTASPASGVLRGTRAAVLAMLCVLLPMVGHVLALGHAPQWVIVAAVGLVALPGAVFLTRRRLTDGQLLGVLVAAQVAHHATYALPGMCRAAAGADATSVLPSWVEHGATLQLPAGSLISGHVITLMVAARVLGVTEQEDAVAEQAAAGRDAVPAGFRAAAPGRARRWPAGPAAGRPRC
ncbi:hypothetical protein SMICM304S_11252 [Streptomyces microflavus]